MIPSNVLVKDITLSSLPSVSINYGVNTLIKTELVLLFPKGVKWRWLINIGGMISLICTPLTIARQLVLPVLWFLQVNCLSGLATKEKTNRIQYFTYAAYRPIKRLFSSQVIAGIVLMVTLATPLILRYLITGNLMQVFCIFAGAVFIASLAVFLGLLSGGKKLFEILFFAITYCNLTRTFFRLF